MTVHALTPSQTAGPFLHVGMVRPGEERVAADDAADAFWLRGRITDGAGEPVTDALVETWQADAAGRFNHLDDAQGASGQNNWFGLGRCPTDDNGEFAIWTVKPGRVADYAGKLAAPHLDVAIYARGLLQHLVTRCYFTNEEDANASDSVLANVPEDSRRTLLAEPSPDGYRFDVRLQGDHATVFFAV